MLEVLLTLSMFFQAQLPVVELPVVEPKDDLVITQSCRIKPGTYRIPDRGEPGVIRVEGEEIALLLEDVTLIGSSEGETPDRFQGTGIIVRGRANVVWGGAVRGYKVGLFADGGEDHWIVRVDAGGNYAQRLASTPEAEDSGDWLWPHENDDGQWAAKYGAGLWLRGVKGAHVLNCWGKDTQNGILLDRVTDTLVRGCDFGFLSGWGLAMWRSSDNRIEQNRFDWCVRGYSHGVYARGQDSAGILMFEQCHRNVIRENSATHSGDGFFLYAGHETTRKTGKGGCNGNLVIGNDFSHSVANGIEATFSTGNRFVENRLDDCNYGIWAGYSRDSVFERNVARSCTFAGVAIEHGSGNTIRENLIENCSRGIDLWWDEDKELIESVYGKANRTDSADTLIEGNVISGGTAGVRLSRSARIRLLGNFIAGVRDDLVVEGECPDLVDEPAKEAPALSLRQVPEDPGVALGRALILMEEFGPFDFESPVLSPTRVDGQRTARFRVLGVEGVVDVVDVTGDVTARLVRVSPQELSVVVSPTEDAGVWVPFRFTLKTADLEIEGSGALLNTLWNVRHWTWTVDPREDEAAFRSLLATEPAVESTRVPTIDFRWGGGGPAADLSPDHFVTVAEAAIALPEGEYELITISDDGVRVFVDDAVVIDDWTFHSPKEDRARVQFDGSRKKLRIEHFEIDGYAVLSFRLRRIE
jgi:parallel beta-helix repeat protein